MISPFNHPVRFSVVLLGCALLSSGTVKAELARFAEHTPGYRHYNEAMRSYRAGHYPSAKSRFKVAARWGDKLSQFNLGVMNYQGQGVPADAVRARVLSAI